MNSNICTYCGATSECKEHVIPVSYLSFLRSYDDTKQWIVPSCNSCNQLASSAVFFSIPDKVSYILDRFKVKYRKLLKQPEWTEEEMDSVDYGLKQMVWGSIVAKRVANERVKHMEYVASLDYNYLRPSFIDTLFIEAKKMTRSVKRKRRVKNKS